MNSTHEGGNTSDPERLARLRDEIEALVLSGAETARYEFTAQCSLAASDRKSQVDFAKTLQGIANALPAEDRIYIVGADQRKKCFTNVANVRDFDSANVSQILGKYLDPIPNFVSYPIETKAGQACVAVLLPADQPRPIVAKANAQDSGGKTILRIGEVWMKKNTALCVATRSDLEAMYETRIESEAERRAQQRFATTRDAMEATFRIRSSPQRQTPTEDLVLGSEATYEAYLEQIFATEDTTSFLMLLTVLRRCLIERWHSFNAYGWYSPEPSTPGDEKLAEHFKNVFQPSLRRLLHGGLLLLEHNLYRGWLGLIAKLLVETFQACAKLEALSEDSRKTIAMEIVVSGRLLGTYAARMSRYESLPALLRENVNPVGRGTSNRQRTEPFLFWPVRMNVTGRDRIAYTWEHSARPYWLRFFGSQKSFVDAACQLDFVVELNSYLATRIPEARQWLTDHYPGMDLSYSPDLWRYPLDSCVPLAEKIFEGVGVSSDWPFILNVSVVHGAFQMAFPAEWTPEQRKARFAGWLRELQDWRSETAASANQFAYEPDWGPILGPHLKRQ
jgi:hypothetical protein